MNITQIVNVSGGEEKRRPEKNEHDSDTQETRDERDEVCESTDTNYCTREDEKTRDETS